MLGIEHGRRFFKKPVCSLTRTFLEVFVHLQNILFRQGNEPLNASINDVPER